MLVHLEGADKYYGARRVLADVTVTVRKGAKIGVVGPNGGGKSTLLRLLAGMDAPEGGRRDTARDVRIGWLGQLVAFAPEHEARTVESYLRDALQHLDELADRVRELERELARLGGAGVGSGPGFEAGPEPGSETGSRTEPDAGSGSRFDTESKTRPEPGSRTEPGTVSHTGSHTVSETESEPGSHTEPGTGSRTGSHTVSETESEPGSHTEPGTGSHTEPGTRSSARAGTRSSAESGNGSPTGIGSSATSGGNDDGRLARVMEQYAAAVARFEQAGGYEADARLRATAFGLGFEAADFTKPVGTLSGGQKVRLALARLLLSEPDILLLDEPTNHLDTQTTAWLESFLQRIPQAVVVVSHDRWFLDAVTDQTWDVDGGTVAVYPAPYTRAQALKLEALQRQQAEHERQQAEIRRLEQFVERYRAGIKARQARGRAARLARMERTGPPAGAVYDVSAAVEGAGPVRRGSKDARSFSASARPRIGFVDPADGGRIGRIGREALRVRGVTKSFGPNPVFVNINLVAERGQRIGVIGANGSGKTTLLRILAGELKPDAGDVVYGSGVRLGYFAQGQEDLDPNRTIADHLLAEHDLTVEELRRHLARFLFFGDEIDAPVGRLSGGERNRVALARLILRRPNVLLLDEPTNHLDVSARIALEGALAEYDGVIIAVSHDRYFLESVCEDLWIVGDGRVSVFSGMYSQWAENAVRPPVPPVPPVLPVPPGQTPPVHARSESVFPGPGLDTSATNRIDTAAGSDLDGPIGHRFDVGGGPGSDATGGALASGHSSRENGIRGVAPISAPSVRPITAAEHRLRQQEERRRRQQRQRRRRQLASEIARIEKEIEQLEATQQEQESLLADPELYTDEERAKETVLAHRETVDTLSRRLEQWEALLTEAEALDSEMPDTKA